MMRDEEQIEMYYKFGLLNWKNEQKLQNTKNRNNIKAYPIYLCEVLVGLSARIIRRYRTSKI
jgi:hypothetical protein